VTSIPERFEKIVRLYPNNLAIKMGDQLLTYDELNQYANRIAHAILERRAPVSEPIALIFEHSIDVVAALLGVLKAGKFYVSLDADFPTERMDYILRDSGAPLILCHGFTLNRVPSSGLSASQVLNIDEIDAGISTVNLDVSIPHEAVANIRYTSGSTGTPKGVTRSHGSSGLNAAGVMGVIPDDHISLLHSVSFGSSALDLYSSLLNGAGLFLFDVKSHGVERLASWLADEKITICHLSPASFANSPTHCPIDRVSFTFA